jgi:hypothetical protein
MMDTAEALYDKEFDFSIEKKRFYKNSGNKGKNLYKAQERCDGGKIIVIPERIFKIIYFDWDSR